MEKLTLDMIEVWLAPIADEAPCGSNLEYAAEFLELEKLVKGKAEEQMGEVLTEAVPPDWKNAIPLTLDLLKRSIDLRLAVILTRGLLNLQGFEGLAIGLRTIDGMLDRYWATLHPQLDPDDDNDPTIRVNTIAALCDKSGFLRDLREASLVEHHFHGRFSLRDIEIATGEASSPDGAPAIDLHTIEACLADTDIDALAAYCATLSLICDAADRIENCLTANAGAMHALDMSELRRYLRKARDFVAAALAKRGGEQATAGEGAASGAGAGSGSGAAAGGPALAGEVRNRSDVLRAIDMVCSYYERNEPNSPVPLLLQRAARLANMNFIDILQDMAPDGLNQALILSHGFQQSE